MGVSWAPPRVRAAGLHVRTPAEARARALSGRRRPKRWPAAAPRPELLWGCRAGSPRGPPRGGCAEAEITAGVHGPGCSLRDLAALVVTKTNAQSVSSFFLGNSETPQWGNSETPQWGNSETPQWGNSETPQ